MGVVIITGVSRFLGGRLAAQLAADPAVERVIGVDTVSPSPDDLLALGRTEFVRADIRNPLIAKVMAQAGVTTVVHAGVMASARFAGGRVPTQEMNVIGTMQLLGACQKSDTVTRVVLASTGAVYGASSRNPAVLTEAMHPGAGARRGYARDAVEVEGYVRGLARRRPDIETTVLRFAHILGPHIDNILGRYLAMPVVPTPAGFDARLQLLHESDAIEALRRATVETHTGVFNVAGRDVLTLAQMIRRLGKRRLPVPASCVGLVGVVLRNSGAVDFAADRSQLLHFGRVLDTTKLREQFGFVPQYSSAATLEAFLDGRRRALRPAVAGLSLGSRYLATRAEPAGVAS